VPCTPQRGEKPTPSLLSLNQLTPNTAPAMPLLTRLSGRRDACGSAGGICAGVSVQRRKAALGAYRGIYTWTDDLGVSWIARSGAAQRTARKAGHARPEISFRFEYAGDCSIIWLYQILLLRRIEAHTLPGRGLHPFKISLTLVFPTPSRVPAFLF
jgi:hypothetical protein